MDYRSYLDTSTGAYVVVGVVLIAWVAIRLSKKSIDLDGPPNPSWIHGTGFNSNERNEQLQEFVTKNYGKAAKYYGKLGNEAIFTSDPVAVHSVLTKDASLYRRSEGSYVLKTVLGGGLLGMQGETHRVHRKALNPVFVHKHLREQMAIFDRIALEACDAIVSNQGVKRGQPFECDIYRYMNASALELIGQAGLGYSFGSFTGRRDEYSSAIKNLLPAISLSSAWLPFLVVFKDLGTPNFRQWVVKMTPSKVVQGLRELVRVQHNQAHEILSTRKALLASEQGLSSTAGSGNDVLTLLMKSNEKLSADSQMSVEDMIGHMNAFIFAGHETTSGAVTRALDVLAAHPDVQNRLRAELTAFMAETGPEDINRDKIDKLPYLDAVCREVLRLFPPVSMTERISAEDTMLPLKFPVKTCNGLQTSVFVPRGITVQIGIYAMNRDKDVWGPDANQFDPKRWLDGRTASTEGSPGTYSRMMTFSTGPMGCIGFKFAVLEIKLLLLRLITRFKFERSSKEFIWMLTGTQAPYPLEDANRPMLERKAQLLMNLTEL